MEWRRGGGGERRGAMRGARDTVGEEGRGETGTGEGKKVSV